MSLAENDQKRVQHFDCVGDLEGACEEKIKQASPSLILFLNGHPSPDWLNTIGWKCNVDPEFLLRHLDFRSSSTEINHFTVPGLPSSTSNIIRLRLASVGCRQYDGARNQKEIQRLRSTAAAQMKEYLVNLKRENDVKTGDSIVRSFAIHDEEHYSLEQDMALCVNKFGKGWLGMHMLHGIYTLSTLTLAQASCGLIMATTLLEAQVGHGHPI